MGAIRKVKRVQIGRANRDEMELAKDLAKDAFLLHEEGVQHATDWLNQAIEDVGAEARKDITVAYEPYFGAKGHGTIVALKEMTETGPEYAQKIFVVTQADQLAASDSAIATAIAYTTKALTFLPDDFGDPIGLVIWQGSTDPQAVGIQTSVSTHF